MQYRFPNELRVFTSTNRHDPAVRETKKTVATGKLIRLGGILSVWVDGCHRLALPLTDLPLDRILIGEIVDGQIQDIAFKWTMLPVNMGAQALRDRRATLLRQIEWLLRKYEKPVLRLISDSSDRPESSNRPPQLRVVK